jgi:ATP-dependent exoDNAse (exonuclease V) alpha subunit
VHFDRQREKWVHGALYYTPLRPAWATTVHKSQGLTLDRVQLDCRAWFFGKPAMAYVALSRCKTPEGLVVVGSPEMLAKKVKVDPRVVEWL